MVHLNECGETAGVVSKLGVNMKTIQSEKKYWFF